MVSLRGSPVYSALQPPTDGQQSYSWPRTSFVANPPRWQDPSSFASLILPQGGVVSVQGWNAYSVSLFLNYPSDYELFYDLILILVGALFFLMVSSVHFLPREVTRTTEINSIMTLKSLQDLKEVSSHPGFIQETLFRSGSMHYLERMYSRKDQANLNANST